MKTILLKGNPTGGKTTTIRLVYDILLYLGAKIIMPTTKSPRADFGSIVEYNGQKIYIYSAGDLKYDIHWAIGKAIENNCDVYIGASRNFVMTDFAKYAPIIVAKTTPPSASANIADAKKIISLI